MILMKQENYHLKRIYLKNKFIRISRYTTETISICYARIRRLRNCFPVLPALVVSGVGLSEERTPGVYLCDGQTEAEGLPSKDDCDDALL